jgi:hypothetical protein
MDETSLRGEFERAVADRPPTPHLVANSVRAGRRLRRRRRIEAAAVSVTAVAAVAILAPLLSGQSSAPGRKGGAAETAVRAQGVAYVLTQVNAATTRVTPVRLSSGKALKPLPVRGVVMALAAAPGGRSVYVFSTPHDYVRNQQNYVTRVNAATGIAGQPVRLRGDLQQIYTVDIAAGGRYAYANGSAAINLATGAVHTLAYSLAAIAPNGKMGLEVRPGGAPWPKHAEVIPVDLVTGAPLAPCKVPGRPEDIAIAPDSRTAYVLSVTLDTSGGAISGNTWLTPIDMATAVAGTPIRVPEASTGAPVIAPDGKTAYLIRNASEPAVIAVSLTGRHAVRTINLSPVLDTSSFSVVIPPHSTTGYAVPLLKWVQPFSLRYGTAETPVGLPPEYRTGYRTVTAPVLDPSGTAFYVGATAYTAQNLREDALIPIDSSSQQPGQPIPLVGLPEQIVIAG